MAGEEERVENGGRKKAGEVKKGGSKKAGHLRGRRRKAGDNGGKTKGETNWRE